MSQISIKVENLSKAYQIGEIGTGTISHDLERWFAKIRGKEDPFLKIGEKNDRSKKGESNIVWSLKDINFEINKGEAVGIIGRNGAGKSTLLKILSKVTAPTTGKISGNGRIASLLEVGTGFHPELTGRENLFLNGAILGMKKKEILRKFDEIVDFSGVERYIDTPVKRYSSGMYVRLAFAVAAHLQSEILIVDEVLAVGDAEFQKKCLGKMGEVSKGEGRTVLFVSHNMAALNNFCEKGIYIDKGEIVIFDKIHTVVNNYLSKGISILNKKNEYIDVKSAPGTEELRIANAEIYSPDIITSVNSELVYKIEFWITTSILNLNLSSHLFDNKGECIFNLITDSVLCEEGYYTASFKIPSKFLNDGIYLISTMFVENRSRLIFNLNESVSFEIIDQRENESWYGKWNGAIRPTFIEYKIKKTTSH